MDKPKVWIKDVVGQCIIETRNDHADDVRSALDTAGLFVNTEMPVDIRSNVYQFVVAMPDGARITAQNVRALLAGNTDIELAD